MEKKNKSRAPGQTAIAISLPKTMDETITKYCEEHDMTKSQYIRQLIREDIKDSDRYKTLGDKK